MKNPTPLLVFLVLAPLGMAQDTELLSKGPSGQANDHCIEPKVSLDGRFVVWETEATNLVPGDTNTFKSIILRDRETGLLELISRTPAGTAPHGNCTQPDISDDGRFVSFVTGAGGILPGHSGGVFLWDRQTRTMVSATGMNGSGATSCAVSGNGRFVVYATNSAIDPLDTNGTWDIYRFDRISQEIRRVSVDASGVQSNRACAKPTCSRSGRWVAFDSWSENWGAAFSTRTHAWVKDMETGELIAASTTQLGEAASGPCGHPSISGDGRWVAFYANGANILGTTALQQIAVKDLITGAVLIASQNDAGQLGNNSSVGATISADGRFVGFQSGSSNLHMGGGPTLSGIWVRDLVEGTTRKVSLSSAALGSVSGTSSSYTGDLSVSGRWFVFSSQATNLTVDDLNGSIQDIFIRDHTGDAPHAYGQPYSQTLGCTPRLETVGTPSASAGSGFEINLNGTRGSQPGLMVYSRTGPAATPLLGSLLYVSTPVVRTSPQSSGGTPGACDGQFSFDFNSWMSAGMDPNLSAGSPVWAQYWTRNPGDPDGAYLSEAVEFTIQP